MVWVELIFDWHVHAMLIRFYAIPCFYFLLFRTTTKKSTWIIAISVRVMVIILKMSCWKLLGICYVQSFFSTIKRHIDKGIWRTSYSWRIYGRGSTYVLILSCVNNMNPKWVKVRGKLWAGKIWVCSLKTIAPRHFTYYCILLFLSNKSSF